MFSFTNEGTLTVKYMRQTLVWLTALLLLCIALMQGCASTAPEVEQGAKGPDPSNLIAAPRSGALDLRWDTNRNESDLISGYNIYVAMADGDFEPQNSQPYPGDNNAAINFETYALEGLQNGEIYRVYVTTVFPGKLESQPTNTIEKIPRPEGRTLLAESFSGSNEGFSFARDEHVLTDDIDNDIYLAVINGRVNLASPNRVDYVLRTTKFFPLGKATSIDSVQITETPSDPVRLVAVAEGDAVLFQDAGDSYGLIFVRSIKGGDKRVIEFDYIYQDRPDTLVFH